jgi:hypothetical protein
VRTELYEFGSDCRVERTRRRPGGSDRGARLRSRCWRSFTGRFRSDEGRYVRFHLVVRLAPVLLRGDQLIEIRDELRNLRSRFAAELCCGWKLRQLTEAFASRRQVSLRRFWIRLLTG